MAGLPLPPGPRTFPQTTTSVAEAPFQRTPEAGKGSRATLLPAAAHPDTPLPGEASKLHLPASKFKLRPRPRGRISPSLGPRVTRVPLPPGLTSSFRTEQEDLRVSREITDSPE